MIDPRQRMTPAMLRLLAGQLSQPNGFQLTGVDASGRPQYSAAPASAPPALAPFAFGPRRTTPDILGKGGIDPRMFSAPGAQAAASPRPDILMTPATGDSRFEPAVAPTAAQGARPDVLAGGYDPRTYSPPGAAARPDILAGADDRMFAQQPAMARPDILVGGDARSQPMPDQTLDPEAAAFAPPARAQTLAARSRVPLPPQRPAGAAAPAQGGFAGPKGPQWSDADYQSWWNRAVGAA